MFFTEKIYTSAQKTPKLAQILLRSLNFALILFLLIVSVTDSPINRQEYV